MTRAAVRLRSESIRPPWAWALVGAVLGSIAATVAFAPAHWLGLGLARLSAEQTRLDDTTGTVWNGSARLVFTGGAGSQEALALPGRLHWQLKPHWTGLDLELRADCCTPEALRLRWRTLGMRAGTVQVQDHRSQWPAALLAGLGTPWNTVRPQGQLHVQGHSLAVRWDGVRVHLEGQIQVDALQMSSRLSTLSPMGSYRVVLDGGNAVRLTLSTLDASGLQLSGQGQWIGSRLRFSGIASAAPNRVDALSNLLNIVGRRDGARSLINLG